MIIVINICEHKLHELEFVKPIEDILKNNKIKYQTIHYKELTNKQLGKADKIIITGTSLKDNEFIKNKNKFNFIKEINKPILGICGGLQIIGLLFGGKIKEHTEIGYYEEDFTSSFLGLQGKKQVYHLHNNYTDFPEDFINYTNSEIPQAVKHKQKPIYGVLFHPEVRNKSLLLSFLG